ncbi:hypothetical protein BABINDRAFT_162574 [Babjeviella inositovora NRRL Y-12698]|uniref:Amino acid permease/ SLC12A domain-containing protein n=1 Tax=Babjeviella inositovora NRRL Y-12698 TaxID=984486 RepID=A0A1E3QPB2_9ASCO|nr:uncharacterized protein BABINDRAFT_162574 [Babjeviella inositovora NRRL Y-12698]ODQ78912.1 hypothetical protein BABINDRAFT_162574 [Babjeviella inositovora NRRL Y-12698]
MSVSWDTLSECDALLPVHSSPGVSLKASAGLSALPRASSEVEAKLGTFPGVFIPTALNVLSILMFLRFGFIIGQMGVVGTLLLLVLSYAINLLTTLSISAIATNGTVRGGGAYYMISRSLGAEFGGSIGIVFYVGQVLNSALNVVGLIEPIMVNFNSVSGVFGHVLEEGYWQTFIYATIMLAICTIVALTGAGLVSKAGTFLFIVLFISTMSVPVSTLFVKPFSVPEYGLTYSGPSWANLQANLFPKFTSGAAGSVKPPGEFETVQSLFGIFFPATAGIFAGASMSGDLRKPSKSIPKGTLWGLLLTFCCYAVVIVSVGAAVPRELLHRDVQVLQTINLSGVIVILGELSTSLFSVIVGIVGAAYVLLAISQDAILPGLSYFRRGPRTCILFTWMLTQLCLFADVNQIATFITMAFLMTFIVTNLACFLLKIASAPNFRPSFKYFSSKTAFLGGLLAVIAMFIVDGLSASLVIVFLSFLFLLIHYTCPPKPWGDVSQSLIYHQVRKYLLRLRQDNVKYWRPQILLLVDDPRTCWNLIQFCNHLKKGGLYILGHVIVTDKFQANYRELMAQKSAWVTLRDVSRIKAFVQIGLGPTLQWGIRNVFLGSGLGGMKPNIVVLGFYDLGNYHRKRGVTVEGVFESSGLGYYEQMKHMTLEIPQAQARRPAGAKSASSQGSAGAGPLPTDSCRREKRVSIMQWVQIVEDLIVMEANVAVAKGFPRLQLPNDSVSPRYIDLYPIQMSSIETLDNGRSILSTNFDTYTLILQLGAILHTVPEWKRTHTLRIIVFVEWLEEVAEEKVRLANLLESLRIKAEVKVLCFNSGEFGVYNVILKGGVGPESVRINRVLAAEDWWANLTRARKYVAQPGASMRVPVLALATHAATKFAAPIKAKRRYTLSTMQDRGAMAFSMKTNSFIPNHVLGAFDPDEAYYEGGSEVSSIYEPKRNASKKQTKKEDLSVSPKTDLKYLRPNASADVRDADSHAPGTSQKRSGSFSSASSRPDLDFASKLRKALNHPTSQKASPRPSGATTPRLKPNFSSVKIPEAAINEASEGSQPSIYFVEETKSYGALDKSKSALRNMRNPSHIFELDDSDSSSGEEDVHTRRDELQEELAMLSFNDIPARGQHLILNDLMKRTSGDADVIFSTLPPPVIGTHLDEAAALEYVENIQIWCEDIPPVMLVNAQTVTVTTAL